MTKPSGTVAGGEKPMAEPSGTVAGGETDDRTIGDGGGRGMCQPRTAGTYAYVRGPLPWNLKEPCMRLPLVAVIWEERQMAEPVRISVIGRPPIVMSLSSSWRVKD
jgi:hypothetical protein